MGWIKKIIYSIWNYTVAPHLCFMCHCCSMTCDTDRIVWKMRRPFWYCFFRWKIGESPMEILRTNVKAKRKFGKLHSQNSSVLIVYQAQKSFMVFFFFYSSRTKCKSVSIVCGSVLCWYRRCWWWRSVRFDNDAKTRVTGGVKECSCAVWTSSLTYMHVRTRFLQLRFSLVRSLSLHTLIHTSNTLLFWWPRLPLCIRLLVELWI